ncbi:MAG: hypothetical protein JWO38_5993 [Gemmataceae bacterium]|nr:hypothetical protein [Gemmataceae bacterium]
MLGWLRSLVFTRKPGGARTGTARPRLVLSLECLDGRSLPSTTSLAGLVPMVESLITYAIRKEPIEVSAALTGLGLSPPELGADGHVELSPVLISRLKETAVRELGETATAPATAAAAGPRDQLVLGSEAAASGPVLDLPQGSPAAAKLVLLLDEWRHDPQAFAASWLASVIEERRLDLSHPLLTPPDEMAGNAHGAGTNGPDGLALSTASEEVDRTAFGTPVRATQSAGIPVDDRWMSLPERAVWIGFRDIPPPDASPPSALNRQAPMTSDGGVSPTPQPQMNGDLGFSAPDSQLLPEVADFLCPVFPFDAAGLQDQVARFRDSLEPVVPMIEEILSPSCWWMSAAVVGVGVWSVVWYSRAPARGLMPEQQTAKAHTRPDGSRSGSRHVRPCENGHIREESEADVAG